MGGPSNRRSNGGNSTTRAAATAPLKLPYPIIPLLFGRDLPHGGDQDQVEAAYGDPTPYLQEDGRPSPAWEGAILSELVPFPTPLPLSWATKGNKAKGVHVHRRIRDLTINTFEALVRANAWIFIDDFGGCFNFRPVRGATHLSMHSWAIALDFNAARYPIRSLPNPADPFIIKTVPIFESMGWTWGGRFHRVDVMHFQATLGA